MSDQLLPASHKEYKLAVIGLGYVGLPLAVTFGGIRVVIGYDINEERVTALQSFVDDTMEVSTEELQSAQYLTCTNDVSDLRDCSCYIVTVPTPIDADQRPDLSALREASRMVGENLAPGNLVIYESTVYPGATEEECVPILEASSGLRFNQDFFCGYSPERINPGDKTHRLPDIMKVTSGSTPEVADLVDALYGEIIQAGTHRAMSIKVAEAAKVIENTQRDLNIALVNEVAVICNRLGIDTKAVLDAAGTKWNFMPFKPGLVGGHCIGVDPYYLTHKAQAIGYHPEVILAGRKMNDGMASYVATQLIKAMIKKSIQIHTARVLIMGVTFKENCPDLRNSKVFDLIEALTEFNITVDIFDPIADPDAVNRKCGILPVPAIMSAYDGVILAVAHEAFIRLGYARIKHCTLGNGPIYDLKGVLSVGVADMSL